MEAIGGPKCLRFVLSPLLFHFNLCAIPREMRRVALVGMQGAGHESESAWGC
jgi:hypothetical protein